MSIPHVHLVFKLNIPIIITVLFAAVALSTQVSVPLVNDLINEDERIVGGQIAQNGMFPWMVALYRKGVFVCTASIISDRTILTAAHCVVHDGETETPDLYDGIVGTVDRDSGNGTRIFFSKLVVDPDYNEDTLRNDVAVLTTDKTLPIGRDVQPICIADPNIGSLFLKKVEVMGWGRTMRNGGGQSSSELQYAKQQVTSNIECSIFFFGQQVPNSIICARGILSGVCDGDSGGPLVYTKRGSPIQVGVASYVNAVVGCGSFLGPAAFSRVSSFTDFITANAQGKVCVRK